MTLIKKQQKDSEASGSSKKKEQKHEEAKETVCQNDSNKEVKPEIENEAAVGADCENPDDGKADGAEPNENGEKQPSEADVLKFYLKQTLDNSKKQKEENESLKKQLEQKNSQLAQFKEKYDGLVAEYENYRRRTTAEKENLGSEAILKAVKALLPTLDNLERAMPFADSNADSFKKGVEMTLRQLSETFKSFGVEEIEAQDAEFDPELHEAVMHVDDENLGESVITDVFQKGYRIGDKVVRHSVVKVAN